MQKIGFIILLAVYALTITGCKKKDIAVTVEDLQKGNATIVLVNAMPDSVFLLLNGHDISTGTIPHIIDLKLAPGDTLTIPRADLRNAYRYQYTWNTADYKYSNWWRTDAKGKAVASVFDYYADTTNYSFTISSKQRNELIILLDGDGLRSNWEAVNAYNAAGISVWDTLADRTKKHGFIISRFHTARHVSLDTNSKEVVTNLSFSIDVSQPEIWLRAADTTDSYILTTDMKTLAPLKTSATDELYYAGFYEDTTGAVIYVEPFYLLKRKNVER